MNIVIYSTSRNSIKYIERFMAVSKDADTIVVVDYDSTDGSFNLLKELGAKVIKHPSNINRFDAYKNVCLEAVPKNTDLCLNLEIDEVLSPRWREELEKVYLADREICKIRCNYLYNGDESKIERIHTRHNYTWIYPVYETLKWTGTTIERVGSANITIERKADDNKLISVAILEDCARRHQNDYKCVFYLGREYFYLKRNDDSIKQFLKYLSISHWDIEKSVAMRYIAECYNRKSDQINRIRWLLRACAEYETRESWVSLAQAYYENKNWSGGYFAANQALKIIQKSEYINEKYAWGDRPFEIGGICAYEIGLYESSLQLLKKAYELNNDERIVNNIKLVESAMLTIG